MTAQTPSPTNADRELPESISALRSLLFDSGSPNLEVQLRMFVSAVRNGTGEKLPKAYYTDILNEIIKSERANAAVAARLDEHVKVIKMRKELDGVGFATWSHSRRSRLRAELAALHERQEGKIND